MILENSVDFEFFACFNEMWGIFTFLKEGEQFRIAVK